MQGTDLDTQLSLLKSVTVTGYDRSDTQDGYPSASMPPVVFSYAEPEARSARQSPWARSISRSAHGSTDKF